MNRNFINTTAIMLALSFATLVNAAPDEVMEKQEKPMLSQSGGSSFSRGVQSDGSISDELYYSKGYSPSAISDCSTNWWVSGNHNWSWKGYYLYLKVKLSATTWTRYGSSTGPCEIPLTVDKLETTGRTLRDSSFAVGQVNINNTVYNTNIASPSGDDKVYGFGLTKGPCGARIEHRATKNGISWSTSTQSGCHGPGTY
tara:strand:+ start:8767 stop:9363 length:597 start_codon:yes stop_codon:yes gene_type:complete